MGQSISTGTITGNGPPTRSRWAAVVGATVTLTDVVERVLPLERQQPTKARGDMCLANVAPGTYTPSRLNKTGFRVSEAYQSKVVKRWRVSLTLNVALENRDDLPQTVEVYGHKR